MTTMNRHLSLKDIVLIGRTFDEYRRMFALDDRTLAVNRILDAASGVSSFCAEANARGGDVTASDIIYDFDPEEIEAKCGEDLEHVMGQLPLLRDLYVWNYFHDIPELRARREHAYRDFLADFRVWGTERYVPVRYPAAPFPAGRFDLALVSHFLFLYEEHLDYAFHKATLRSLLRVAREVRVFPLLNLKGGSSRHLGALLGDRDFDDCAVRIVPVDYEFMKDGNRMLVIRKD